MALTPTLLCMCRNVLLNMVLHLSITQFIVPWYVCDPLVTLSNQLKYKQILAKQMMHLEWKYNKKCNFINTEFLFLQWRDH